MSLSIDALRRCLPDVHTAGRFKIRHGAYAPGGASPQAFRGVRCKDLIDAYGQGFEAADRQLTRIFAKTPLPQAEILVFHIPDFTYNQGNSPFTLSLRGSTVVALPNRSFETSPLDRMDRARCEAAHELVHVYQLCCPERGYEHWRWIREGTAVFFETHIFPGSREGLYYYQNWLDSPEVPLDRQSYTSAMFVRWLAKRFGPEMIGRIWEESGLVDTPLRTIARLTGAVIADLFHDYARDAWFLTDSSSGCCFPEIQEVWGLPEARHTLDLAPGKTESVSGRVDHLAANYVRIDCAPAAQIRCTLHSELSGEIAEYRPDHTRGERKLLPPSEKVPIHFSGATGPSHLVVTVSNGWDSPEKDGVDYRLIVTAV